MITEAREVRYTGGKDNDLIHLHEPEAPECKLAHVEEYAAPYPTWMIKLGNT